MASEWKAKLTEQEERMATITGLDFKYLSAPQETAPTETWSTEGLNTAAP